MHLEGSDAKEWNLKVNACNTLMQVLQTCETWKSQRSPVPFWVIENPDKENLECRDLSQLSDVLPESAMLCMSDPCHLSGYPGWILRNCLFLLAHRWRCRAITVNIRSQAVHCSVNCAESVMQIVVVGHSMS